MATGKLDPSTAGSPQPVDFPVAIYDGQGQLASRAPSRIQPWSRVKLSFNGMYSEEQLDKLAVRLLEGKSWVTFSEPGNEIITLIKA